MRWLVRLVYLLILLICVAVATLVVNQEPVSVEFLGWVSPEYDLSYWLLGAVLLGIGIGWMMSSTWLLRLKLNERRERKEKTQAENQLRAAQAKIDAAADVPEAKPAS